MRFDLSLVSLWLLSVICTAAQSGDSGIDDDDDDDDDPFDFDTGFLIRMCTNTTAVAGEAIAISVNVNKTTATEPESNWNAYRLMLAKKTDASDTVTGPVCTYSDCLPIESNLVTVVIDPAWGPSGSYYPFTASFFVDKDINTPSYYRSTNSSQLVYTGGFWYGINVTGMTGQFYDFEAKPPANEYGHNWPFGLPIYPCAAYQCARECIDRYFGEVSESEGYTDLTLIKIKRCADACPGAQTITNNCPAVGGVPVKLADGVDSNFVPDGCKSSEERSSSSSLAATATETAPLRPSSRPANSGVRKSVSQGPWLMGLSTFLYLVF